VHFRRFDGRPISSFGPTVAMESIEGVVESVGAMAAAHIVDSQRLPCDWQKLPLFEHQQALP
jgi:hypothetical protein